MPDPVIKTIEVACTQDQAFSTFVNKASSWWPLDKNSVSAMNGEVAKTVTIEAKEGGAIYEIGHDDTRHEWGSVTTYQPSERLVLNWHIGLPPQKASTVEVVFTQLDNNRTQVVLTHSDWEVFGEKANDMREGYNKGWVGVFEQAYASLCSTNA